MVFVQIAAGDADATEIAVARKDLHKLVDNTYVAVSAAGSLA